MVAPLCENQLLIHGLKRDFKAKVLTKKLPEKCLIHDYLDSLTEGGGSPFSVAGIHPTYTKMLTILNLVVLTLGWQLLSAANFFAKD